MGLVISGNKKIVLCFPFLKIKLENESLKNVPAHFAQCIYIKIIDFTWLSSQTFARLCHWNLIRYKNEIKFLSP